MKVIIGIGIICALFYFGLSFSVKKSTACAGISDTRACLTLNIR
jgi:hypothetical protein